MRHTLLSVAALWIAFASLAQASAWSATIPSRPTPLSLSTTGATPGCPTLEDLDGSTVAAKLRMLFDRADTVDANPSETAFYTALLYSVFELNPVVTVGVCDPALAAAGRPLGSITGAATTVPSSDIAGFGLRVLGAPAQQRGTAASVGDRFSLPAVGPQAQVSLAVATPSGTRSLRLGPFASAPTEVRIEGTAAAPVAAVTLASGTAVTQPVARPSAVKTTISVKAGKGRNADLATFSVRGAPRAIVAVHRQVPADESDPSDDLLDLGSPSPVAVADAKGRVSRRFTPPTKRFVISVLDPERRALVASACQARLSRRRIQRLTCTRARPRVIPTGTVSGLAAQLAASAPTSTARPATSPAPIGVGNRTRALAIAPADLSIVERVPAAEQLGEESLFELQPLLGDVNGDGRPDLGSGDPLVEPSLALSNSTGWNKVPVKGAIQDLVAVPDVTGDGVDDIILPLGDSRFYAGSARWAASPPTSITVDPRSAPGLNDLFVSEELTISGDARPFGLPDVTGDGRPEIAVASASRSGIGVFSSASLPFGVKNRLPVLQTTSSSEDLAVLDGFSVLFDIIDDDDEEDPTFAAKTVTPESSLLTVRGGTIASKVSVQASDSKATSTVELRRLSTTAPWSFAAAPTPLIVAGIATIGDYDPASGDVLVLTESEGCRRTDRCVLRVRRVDASGRVVGTVSVRAASDGLTARFTNDGPDPDSRLDVLIREDSPFAFSTSPAAAGFQGTIAVWASDGPPALALSSLPALGSGGVPLTVAGELSHWTDPEGRRFHAGYAVAGRRTKATETLTLIGALR